MIASKPVHGTHEWAVHNVNIQTGCEHDCRYCYAKCMGARFKRCSPSDWGTPTILAHKVDAAPRKHNGRVMFPTTHDITPANVVQSVAVLAGLCGMGNEVLVVTKPHLDCVRRLCTALAGYREQILFRFTIGSENDRVLSYWEPNAPPFKERLRALKHACDQGFSTSVSCEPMLDTKVEAVIQAVRGYVTDSIWLGRVNQLPASVAINCPGDQEAKKAARALLAEQTDGWIAMLYDRWHNDSMIKWKDSIKKVVGIERPRVKGLDV